jgi:phosphonate transport system substrate-binding protein
MNAELLMGAVCYDAKVVTIWTGFRRWLRDHDLPFDFVLYSNYERQVDDLVAGHLHAAWNSPLAWVRAHRYAAARGRSVRPLVMRDTDRDLTSVFVVRADSAIEKPGDLDGATVATGAVDSPQATLIPLHHLGELGVTVTARRFDVGVGLHGDHVGGERDAARALMAGEVDAACLLDATHLLLSREGVLPPGATRIAGQTPAYDHCNLTVIDTAPSGLVDRFGALLRGMSFADPALRPLLELEGLTSWEAGRTGGYETLSAAVDRFGFYGASGELTAQGYRP